MAAEASPFPLAEQWRRLVLASEVYATGRGDRQGTALYLHHRANELLRAMTLTFDERHVLIAVLECIAVHPLMAPAALELEAKGLLVGVTKGSAPGVWTLTDAAYEFLARYPSARAA